MTQIEWTHLPGFKGASWNPVVGCSVVSPGCTNCYAMKQAGRILRMTDGQSHYAGTVTDSKAGTVWTGKVTRTSDKAFTAPLRRRIPTCYFVNSMGDLFAEGVADEWIDQVFAVMGLSPQHRFIVLTKRPERMREYLRPRPEWDYNQGATPYRYGKTILAAREITGSHAFPVNGWPLPNVWLGVSVEDQPRADERIPLLLDTPAAVRFISAEPLLGPVDLECVPWPQSWPRPIDDVSDGIDPLRFRHAGGRRDALDWVICGGESGPDARPMHPDWARSLRDQCAAAGVPFFFKQWGEWAPCPVDRSGHCRPEPFTPHDGYVHPDGKGAKWPSPGGFGEYGPRELARRGFAPMAKFGKRTAGHLLDGIEHFNWPADPAGVPA